MVMPHGDGPGSWRGWWEGVVDLTLGENMDITLERLFGRGVPRAFPEADESILRVVGEDVQVEPDTMPKTLWLDGRARTVYEWDLRSGLKDVRITFEEPFQHRKSGFDVADAATAFTPADVAITRRILNPVAGDGTFLIRIHNPAKIERVAVYSEVWPWWLKGWMHEMTVSHSKPCRESC